MLTKKQHELLIFIHDRLKEKGVPPSFEEMKEAVALKSKSGIHRLITGLEERGFIRRLPNKARALEVLRLPQDINDTPRKSGLNLPDISSLMKTPAANTVELHLYGKIAAGTPIEALRGNDTTTVPADMLGSGEHYALTVAGDSMIDAGILNGDTVIIRKGNTAMNGEIVVALVDGAEVTLKRIRKKGNALALEPANPAYETKIYSPERITIQGKLVGLMRTYK